MEPTKDPSISIAGHHQQQPNSSWTSSCNVGIKEILERLELDGTIDQNFDSATRLNDLLRPYPCSDSMDLALTYILARSHGSIMGAADSNLSDSLVQKHKLFTAVSTLKEFFMRHPEKDLDMEMKTSIFTYGFMDLIKSTFDQKPTDSILSDPDDDHHPSPKSTPAVPKSDQNFTSTFKNIDKSSTEPPNDSFQKKNEGQGPNFDDGTAETSSKILTKKSEKLFQQSDSSIIYYAPSSSSSEDDNLNLTPTICESKTKKRQFTVNDFIEEFEMEQIRFQMLTPTRFTSHDDGPDLDTRSGPFFEIMLTLIQNQLEGTRNGSRALDTLKIVAFLQPPCTDETSKGVMLNFLKSLFNDYDRVKHCEFLETFQILKTCGLIQTTQDLSSPEDCLEDFIFDDDDDTNYIKIIPQIQHIILQQIFIQNSTFSSKQIEKCLTTIFKNCKQMIKILMGRQNKIFIDTQPDAEMDQPDAEMDQQVLEGVLTLVKNIEKFLPSRSKIFDHHFLPFKKLGAVVLTRSGQKKFVDEADGIFQKILQTQHYDYLKTRQEWAEVLKKKLDFASALQVHQEVLEYQENLFEISHLDILSTKLRMADLYLLLNDEETGFSLFENSLSILHPKEMAPPPIPATKNLDTVEKIRQKDDLILMARLEVKLAHFYLKKEDLENSLKFHKKFLKTHTLIDHQIDYNAKGKWWFENVCRLVDKIFENVQEKMGLVQEAIILLSDWYKLVTFGTRLGRRLDSDLKDERDIIKLQVMGVMKKFEKFVTTVTIENFQIFETAAQFYVQPLGGKEEALRLYDKLHLFAILNNLEGGRKMLQIQSHMANLKFDGKSFVEFERVYDLQKSLFGPHDPDTLVTQKCMETHLKEWTLKKHSLQAYSLTDEATFSSGEKISGQQQEGDSGDRLKEKYPELSAHFYGGKHPDGITKVANKMEYNILICMIQHFQQVPTGATKNTKTLYTAPDLRNVKLLPNDVRKCVTQKTKYVSSIRMDLQGKDSTGNRPQRGGSVRLALQIASETRATVHVPTDEQFLDLVTLQDIRSAFVLSMVHLDDVWMSREVTGQNGRIRMLAKGGHVEPLGSCPSWGEYRNIQSSG